MLTQTGPKS